MNSPRVKAAIAAASKRLLEMPKDEFDKAMDEARQSDWAFILRYMHENYDETPEGYLTRYAEGNDD